MCRSSRREVFCKKGVLRNLAKFTVSLLKKRLWYRCFPVNFATFLRTPLFTEHLRWLLLGCVMSCDKTTFPFLPDVKHQT